MPLLLLGLLPNVVLKASVSMLNLKGDSLLYRICFERILTKTQGLLFAYTYLHFGSL